MLLEIVLMGITLSAAVMGTYKDGLSSKFKAGLIILAILTGIGSLIKSYKDNLDKSFMQTALIANLNPSNSYYEKLTTDVEKTANEMGFDKEVSCYHSYEGMVCSLSDKKGDKHGTVVLNRSEIAEMYANHIKKSNDKKVIKEAIEKLYEPKNFNEEFMEKVGILGFGTFFDIFDKSPSFYGYNPKKFGVRIFFNKDGREQNVEVNTSEIEALPQDKALNLFHRLGENFREKFKEIASK